MAKTQSFYRKKYDFIWSKIIKIITSNDESFCREKFRKLENVFILRIIFLICDLLDKIKKGKRI